MIIDPKAITAIRVLDDKTNGPRIVIYHNDQCDLIQYDCAETMLAVVAHLKKENEALMDLETFA